jgi:two-component system, cell cycle sensor histidine kinase and response regulator CckA
MGSRRDSLVATVAASGQPDPLRVRMGHQKSWIHLLPTTAAVVAIVVGILVLLGWGLDIEVLRTFIPGMSNAMVPSTALCFVLAGASLWLLRDEEGHRPQRRIGRAYAFIVAAIGLLKLSEYVFGWDLGIDQTLLTKNAGPFPGQMAIPSAFGFVLIGAALMSLDYERTSGSRPAQTFTLVAGLFPLLGLIGRLYDVPTLSRLVGGTVAMALHTAITFSVVCAGVLAARPSSGLMRIVTTDGPGRLLLRRLLPSALGVVVLAGWVRLTGERSGLYAAEFGVSLFAIFTIVLLTLLIGRTARSLYMSDLERREAEEKLKESEQRQKAMLASIADIVLITDSEGAVVSINRAMERLSGWSQEEAEGMAVEDVCPLVDARGQFIVSEKRFLARAIGAREVVVSRGYDVSLLTRDGRRIPVSVAAAPILDEQGELLGGVDVLRDVSHEREVDQLKSSLISTVSHELRTPLTMIQGFSELLLTREVDEKNTQEALEQINVSARRLGRLIEDLLSVSRIESGRLDVRLAPVDLPQAVEEVSALFDRDREVRIEAAADLPPVMADGELLIRILTNLLSNAVKYSPPDTLISVTARRIGTNVEVSVSDRGIGMTKAETTRLFDKFFRADRPEVRSAGGTGLGLYITRNLVEMQGGQIWAESELGRGTSFRFTLALALQDAQLVAP